MNKKVIDLTDFKTQVVQKANNKNALGRGIAALIGDIAVENSTQNINSSNFKQVALEDNNLANRSYVSEIEIKDCIPSRFQMRKTFSDDSLSALSQSIKVNGVLQPILVRELDSTSEAKYEIVAGERRFLASKMAEKLTIPAIILKLTDKSVMEIGIIENLQREDLNPIDEANAYQSLIFKFGYSHEEVSTLVGKSRSYITNYLRILNLPEEIKNFISQGRLKLSHAKILTTAKNPIEVAEMVVKNNMSVIELEELLRQESALRGDFIVSPDYEPLNKANKISTVETDYVGRQISKIMYNMPDLSIKLNPKTATTGTLVVKYKNIHQLKAFLDSQ